MKGFIAVAMLALAAQCSGQCNPTVTTVSGTHAPGQVCSGALIFEENFDQLDNRKWQHENTLAGGGNWEFQWYNNNRTNSFCREGALNIRPSLLSGQFGEDFVSSGYMDIEGGAPADRCTDPSSYGCQRQGGGSNILNPIKSARLRTVQSFNFRYGRIEIAAKMPAGDWLWPALWLMPAYNSYGTWPASGEIDLMESRGNRDLVSNGQNIGTQMAGHTLHFGPNGFLNSWDRAHYETINPAGFDRGFNRFQLEWTPDYLKFSVNDVESGRVTPPEGGFWQLGDFDGRAPNTENPWKFNSKMAPFDQEFYILINLAVGGVAYFPDGASNPDPKPWSNNSPTAMLDFWQQRDRWLRTWGLENNEGSDASLKVDYVRVWAL